jgi:hypothetical protein
MNRYLLSLKDPGGITVLLDETQWIEHILSRHPEVEHFLEDVGHAIETPAIRQFDPLDARIELYYYEIPLERRLNVSVPFLLVVVKYVAAPEFNFEKTGFVTSVYFVEKPKKRGTIL